jgi:hypothetical protein
LFLLVLLENKSGTTFTHGFIIYPFYAELAMIPEQVQIKRENGQQEGFCGREGRCAKKQTTDAVFTSGKVSVIKKQPVLQLLEFGWSSAIFSSHRSCRLPLPEPLS